MTARPKIKVLLIDNHLLVLDGLKAVLETFDHIEVAGTAGLAQTGLDIGREVRPQVVLMDINMPKLNGIDVAARVRSMERPPAVIILSMYADESHVIRALEAGARAYLLKSSSDEDLVPALRAVLAGKPFFSPAVTGVLIEDYVHRLQMRGLTDTVELLTDREKQVLQLLAEGRSNKDVAAELSVGLSTVETHRANLMQKLNLHNTAEIVLYAVRKGLIA